MIEFNLNSTIRDTCSNEISIFARVNSTSIGKTNFWDPEIESTTEKNSIDLGLSIIGNSIDGVIIDSRNLIDEIDLANMTCINLETVITNIIRKVWPDAAKITQESIT